MMVASIEQTTDTISRSHGVNFSHCFPSGAARRKTQQIWGAELSQQRKKRGNDRIRI